MIGPIPDFACFTDHSSRNLQTGDAVDPAFENQTCDGCYCASMCHVRVFHSTNLPSDVSTTALP